MRQSQSQSLANRIALFFARFDELGGATVEEMYEATYKALENHDVDDIRLIKDYFRDLRWANEKAQEIYRELDLYY